VAIPTETVYGLAGLIAHPPAIARIFSAKERPFFDPLIVHVGVVMKSIPALESAGIIDLHHFDENSRQIVRTLIDHFWPGPLTLVLPRGSSVPDLATSGLSTVGVRMPAHPIAQSLLALSGPFAAPSANRFGRISPTTPEAVRTELGDRIELILDGGPCQVGVESTIVSVHERGTLTLLRAGGIPREKIETLLGTALQTVDPTRVLPIAAPGMLESHYAPEKSVTLLPRSFSLLSDNELTLFNAKGVIGLLLLSGDARRASFRLQQLTGCQVVAHSLSVSGNLEEVAQNLFAGMRAIDESAAEQIWIEPCPESQGLGAAIADRLQRAAGVR
jgi:L-threonylcarbamoyladenylate synthase